MVLLVRDAVLPEANDCKGTSPVDLGGQGQRRCVFIERVSSSGFSKRTGNHDGMSSEDTGNSAVEDLGACQIPHQGPCSYGSRKRALGPGGVGQRVATRLPKIYKQLWMGCKATLRKLLIFISVETRATTCILHSYYRAPLWNRGNY